MKGDNIRGEKLFQKMILGDKFRNSLKILRTKIKVNEQGFSDEKSISEWYSKHGPSARKMDKLITIFIQEQDVPDNWWWRHKITEYILSNGVIKIFPFSWKGKSPFIEINYEYRARFGRVDLQLYRGVTQQEVSNFYRINKLLIEPPLREGSTKKIRGKEIIKVSNRINELWNKTKKELGGKYNESKEILISRKLREEELYYEPENIKQIYYRTKHLKR